MHHPIQNNLSFFEVKKNIRFVLEPLFEPSTSFEEESNMKTDIKNFLHKYDLVTKTMYWILLNQRRMWLNNKLKIKFCFLKNHTKDPYFENGIEKLKNKHKNQLEMSRKELEYLVEVFQNFFQENFTYSENLKQLLSQTSPQNPDIKYYFHQIARKANFDFLSDISDSINTEVPSMYWKITAIKEIMQELHILKNKIQNNLHQEQSLWKTIEISNLNYFLANKKSKNYSELILNKENSLFHHIFAFPKFHAAKEENGLKDFENIYSLQYSHSRLTETYELLKEYKSSQKEWLLQFIQQWYSFEDLQNHTSFILKSENFEPNEFSLTIHLFDDVSKENFEIIKVLSNKINFLIEIKNNSQKLLSSPEEYKDMFQEELMISENIFDTKKALTKKIIQLKKERGTFFNTESQSCMFKKYAYFCAEYKKITLEIGKIKAQIKNLKEEQIQVERTNSWALILEKDSQKFLLTIPREKINNSYFEKESNILQARNFIQWLSHQNNDYKLFHFESLSLKTLDKLCFAKESSYFRNKIAKELYHINSDFVDKKEFVKFGKTIEVYNIKMKYELPKTLSWETCKKTLLNFYQSVIKLNGLKEQIIIENTQMFEQFVNKNFETLLDFEKELKQICYIKQSLFISEETKEILIKNYYANLYKITSYDLEKSLKRTNIKTHTKIWHGFWNEKNNWENFPIRINPEIKISFIKKDDSIEQNTLNKKTNRKLNDRYLLTTNITQHACKNSWFINEKTKKEIIHFYENFNQDFEKRLPENHLTHSYFIDIWENNSIKLSIYDNKNNIPVEIKTHTLKEECFLQTNEKSTPAYKNISYFQYDNFQDLYNIESVQYLDLSTTKLVNGKIYLGGDISTYLNLKINCAKKKISQHDYSQISISEANPNHIILTGWNLPETIAYNFDERYKIIQSKEAVIKELEEFLEAKNIDSYFPENISIENTNNLKNALCWNIVWVVFFLQKFYPGKIIIRNFTTKESLSCPDGLDKKIEEKILQKLSSLSLIPSNYRHILELKNKNILNKLGIIEFVN